MNKITFEKNELIHSYEQEAHNLELILSGKVEAKSDNLSLTLKKGCIIGLFEYAASPYQFEYKATEDTTVISYPYTKSSDLADIINENFTDCDNIVTACAALTLSISSKYNYFKRNSDIFINVIKNTYETYKKLCNTFNLNIQTLPFLDNYNIYTPEKEVPEWLNDFYDQLEIMPRNSKSEFYGVHPSLATATVLESAHHMKLYINMCNDIKKYTEELVEHYFSGADIFNLYKNLQIAGKKLENKNLLFEKINENIESFVSDLGKNPLIPKETLGSRLSLFSFSNDALILSDKDKKDSNIYNEIKDSLHLILDFTNLDEGEVWRIISLLDKYKSIKDKNANDENTKNIRDELTKSFFDIYEAAFISSVELTEIPAVLKMFFNFGYLDENLVGLDNAITLYELNTRISNTDNIFTIYDWLLSIYKGENEPSINEYDQEYPTYLKAQRQQGLITLDMEKRYLQSPAMKLRFEIKNIFTNAMKMCVDRPRSFCPILSDHNIIKSLEEMFVTSKKIENNWNKIKAIDYSCFYRECFYNAPEYRIMHTTIMQEIMPIVILMPTVGVRGGLWQETSGAARNTAARMFFPIFASEDTYNMQIVLAGQFKWNMCKKIQGARWNDVTEHSLTSDYFDYLQFFKRNNDLSADAKEKIRNTLANNRNNFKNTFISDYFTWIKYESSGSPRLNKVARRILFDHCPFSKDIRKKLSDNPLYQKQIFIHNNKNEKKFRALTALYEKKQKEINKPLPNEIIEGIKYYNK